MEPGPYRGAQSICKVDVFSDIVPVIIGIKCLLFQPESLHFTKRTPVNSQSFIIPILNLGPNGLELRCGTSPFRCFILLRIESVVYFFDFTLGDLWRLCKYIMYLMSKFTVSQPFKVWSTVTRSIRSTSRSLLVLRTKVRGLWGPLHLSRMKDWLLAVPRFHFVYNQSLRLRSTLNFLSGDLRSRR